MSVSSNSFAGRWDELKAQSDSPVVRWSVLAIGVIAVWVWLVEPLQAWTADLQAQVDRSAQKATRMVALEENAAQWLKAQEEARKRLDEGASRLFDEVSDTQAQAVIQSTLARIATDRGLSIQTQKQMVPELNPPVGKKLGVELVIRGGLVDMLVFLDHISSAEKLFVVDHWMIQVDERSGDVFARIVVAGMRPVGIGESDDV